MGNDIGRITESNWSQDSADPILVIRDSGGLPGSSLQVATVEFKDLLPTIHSGVLAMDHFPFGCLRVISDRDRVVVRERAHQASGKIP